MLLLFQPKKIILSSSIKLKGNNLAPLLPFDIIIMFVKSKQNAISGVKDRL